MATDNTILKYLGHMQREDGGGKFNFDPQYCHAYFQLTIYFQVNYKKKSFILCMFTLYNSYF